MTCSHTFSHFFLQVNGLPQCSQVLDGRFDFLIPLGINITIFMERSFFSAFQDCRKFKHTSRSIPQPLSVKFFRSQPLITRILPSKDDPYLNYCPAFLPFFSRFPSTPRILSAPHHRRICCVKLHQKGLPVSGEASKF